MIDLQYAYDAFEEYLQAFDQENERIRLKIVHTYGVVHDMKEITKRMGLGEEDCRLAELIALLHDIGRFEQAKRYDSFEPFTMDHARFGVELLFSDDRMIRKFIKEDIWDDIIRVAIDQHSLYELKEIYDERILLHARLIRDADKLDNCRVKLEESLDVLLGMTAEEVGALEISDQIWETCLKEKSILSSDRVTKMDYWVSYIAYFYDINFKETFSIILENDYIPQIFARIPYSNPDTKEKMEIFKEAMMRYIRNYCGE
ncbi:MAG: HD domain-containing protein [Eubacteriales bacterium]|nr:HD domain-containing protein [Eubacteriales bacterium]